MESATSSFEADLKSAFDQIFVQLPPADRKSKIICTLGPACWDTENLVKMLDAGMNVARLNFSHGDHASHGKSVANLRAAMAQRPDKPCSILLDTKGPEIRTGAKNKGGASIEIKSGQTLKITTDYSYEGDSECIACSYPELPTTVKVGSIIFVADSSLTCEVTEIGDTWVNVLCKNGMKLGQRKNMCLPGAIVKLPTLTAQDEKDLVDFGIPTKVDFIAASFVRKASDVEYIRKVLGEAGKDIHIMSKIENQEGLQNYDEILAASDAIMVARGDLGMEIPLEKVFIAQKWMIAKANVAGKPVVTATQMLESMINAPRPTRAEASDVANAILDGSDCVMLSGESANGEYPTNAVSLMAASCTEAEKRLNNTEIFASMSAKSGAIGAEEEGAKQAVKTANEAGVSYIFVLAEGQAMQKQARLMAKYRPVAKIIACCYGANNQQIVSQMNANRGVFGRAVNDGSAIPKAVFESCGLATGTKVVQVIGGKAAVTECP